MQFTKKKHYEAQTTSIQVPREEPEQLQQATNGRREGQKTGEHGQQLLKSEQNTAHISENIAVSKPREHLGAKHRSW